jgi:hypothetical protein
MCKLNSSQANYKVRTSMMMMMMMMMIIIIIIIIMISLIIVFNSVVGIATG